LSSAEWPSVFKRAAKRFLADDCLGLAKQIAYSSLLAFFPAVVALVGLLDLIGAYDTLQRFLDPVAPKAVVELIKSFRHDTRGGGSLIAFLVGTMCVCVAGMLMAPLFSTYPTVGLQFVLVAFVVVVLGGLGSAVGALVGALIVAFLDVIGGFYVGTAWKEVLYFVVFIAVLLLRPAGLLGQRGAEELGR